MDKDKLEYKQLLHLESKYIIFMIKYQTFCKNLFPFE
jgi:hypothetical protein